MVLWLLGQHWRLPGEPHQSYIGMRLAFELPVIAYVLARVGLITPSLLKKKRKYAIVILVIVSAVITPSPDWMSQMIVFVPLWILYELSIGISKKIFND